MGLAHVKPLDPSVHQTTPLVEMAEWVPEKMAPGSVFLLARRFPVRRGRNRFVALLACPQCGTPGLITEAQYAGRAPVMCPSELCCCAYRIENRTHIAYLRVH
jgi:hypothetical protein